MGSNTRFTNLYVKNFASEIDENGLKEMFVPYGQIISAVVMKGPEGESRGFGFVSYDNHDSAAKVKQNWRVCTVWVRRVTFLFLFLFQAIEELNGKKKLENGALLYVSRAQKKKERKMELVRKHEAEKMERYNR